MPGTLNVGGHNIITHSGTSGAGTVDADNIDTVNIGNNALVVDSSGNVGVGTSAPVAPLQIDSNASGDTPLLRLNNKNNTNGDTCNILFGFAGNNNANKGGIFFKRTNSYGRGDLIFATENSASNDNVDNSDAKLTINSNGHLLVGTTAEIYGDDAPVHIKQTNTSSGNNACLALQNMNAAGGSGVRTIAFINSSGSINGSISNTSSATAYNTSSDYRLKENITEITDGISRVKQLNPSRFNFIVDPNNTVDGFIAHEVQTIVPEAISGEKDAVDEDGSIAPQGIDQSKLVPLLTAALQEAIALIESQQTQIDALTTRIEALENA